MQNVIRSNKAGATVRKLRGELGASLRADEILLEFEELESASSSYFLMEMEGRSCLYFTWNV